MRVPGDLPEMAVGVGEIAGAAAPERRLRAPRNAGAGGFRLRQQAVDVVGLAHIVGERDAAKSRAFGRNARIAGECGAREQRQREAAEREEYDIALARRRGAEAKAVLVEGAGAGEIGDA